MEDPITSGEDIREKTDTEKKRGKEKFFSAQKIKKKNFSIAVKLNCCCVFFFKLHITICVKGGYSGDWTGFSNLWVAVTRKWLAKFLPSGIKVVPLLE